MNVEPTASTEFMRAASYDAAGQHDEAINALARGTQAGDLACMAALAKRLMAGDRAPLLVKEGLGFLLQAAKQGNPDALTRVATLRALGYLVTQDWHEAFRHYALAAAGGWHSAQMALKAIAPDPEAVRPALDNPAMWPEAIASWDVAALLASPPGVTLHPAPLLRSVPAFIPPALCNWVIERSRSRLVRAKIYDAGSRADVISQNRSNSTAIFSLMEAELPHLLVQARMSAACNRPVRNMEAPAILHYAVGEQISPHYDFVSPDTPGYAEEIRRNGQRMVTFLVYLNDDYAGGETAFPELGIQHKGARGSALYFENALQDGQPDLRTLHAGCPPHSGEKWIISQFIRGHAVIAAGI
jgi:prolyl 4-hydroxylase